MSKGKKKEKEDSAKRVLERIRRSAALLKKGDYPDELFDDVLWMVERGLEEKVYQLIEEEEYDEEVLDVLAMALHEAGYRLYLSFVPASKQEKASVREEIPAIMIPFAIIFAVPVLIGEAASFPTELPLTIKRAAEDRIIRDALGLDEGGSIFLDDRLYRVDHTEWRQESAAREYLNSLASYLTKSKKKFPPLAADYNDPPQFHGDPYQLERMSIIQRAVCGAVLTNQGEEGEEALEFEDHIFGESEEGRFDALGNLIKEELASHMAGPEFDVFVYPYLVELNEVPESGLQLQRTIQISLETERAMQNLLEMAPPGEVIEPLLYVSRHGGDEVVEEIRLAAYGREAEDEEPFFTFVWEIVHELEDPEDVSEAIVEISKQLNAKILLVEEILSDERCDDCGAKLYHGPGGLSHGTEYREE